MTIFYHINQNQFVEAKSVEDAAWEVSGGWYDVYLTKVVEYEALPYPYHIDDKNNAVGDDLTTFYGVVYYRAAGQNCKTEWSWRDVIVSGFETDEEAEQAAKEEFYEYVCREDDNGGYLFETVEDIIASCGYQKYHKIEEVLNRIFEGENTEHMPYISKLEEDEKGVFYEKDSEKIYI
jgi:hypothetical protein